MSRFLDSKLPLFIGAVGLIGAAGIMFAGNNHSGGMDEVDTKRAQTQAKLEEREVKIGELKLQIGEILSEPVPVSEGDPMPQNVQTGLGRDALEVEVAAWDIDVRPDGKGLPIGSGDVFAGEEVFVENCASCHGDFGEAVGRWPILAGGHDTLTEEDPVKTIGSYWPYLSTVYDYIYRAMPFGNAQSLSHDDVYAITAYLLYVNDLVDEDFELSNENFSDIRLPNEENFFPDDRPETELAVFTGEPCMADCKDAVDIVARAMVIDVTPEEEGAAEAVSENGADGGAEGGAVDTEELLAKGAKVFRKCQSCHDIGDGARNKSGPQLTAVFGRTMGGVEGFKYSGAFQEAANAGRTWDDQTMNEFITKPKAFMPGTKMGFAGIKKPEDIEALIAYMKSVGG